MPDSQFPTDEPLNEPLNTAKQIKPENVGAVSRTQLTPEAAASPQGHDVPGHDHAAATAACTHAGTHAEDDGHDHGPAAANPYLLPGISLANSYDHPRWVTA